MTNFIRPGGGSFTKSISVTIPADGELIITVPSNEPKCSASIKLEPFSGTADSQVDVAGSPLVTDISYYLLPGVTLNVFAWTTSVVRIEGSEQLLRGVIRTSTKSITRPLVEYHCVLHTQRVAAEKTQSCGPMMLICGGQLAGKIMVARTLANYAARAGWKPILVDMDPGVQQMVGLPGSIGAAIVDYPLSLDEIMALSFVSTTYFVGTTEVESFNKLGEAFTGAAYVHFSKLLLNCVRERLLIHSHDLYGFSGAIILLPEVHGSAGMNVISELIQQYDISNVLCLGDDDLFHTLYLRHDRGNTALSNYVKIDRISHNFSVVPPVNADAVMPLKYSDYFLGTGAVDLHPSQWSKPFNNIDVLILKEEHGQVVLSPVPKEELQGIVGCIGALYSPKSGSALQASPVAYARVQTIDPTGVCFLTSTHFTFPSEKLTLLVGSVRWITST
ncbi:N-terminal beta-sandwich domain of polyadenylation factor [Leishmania utingensis]|uniref:N-terminal beta-sandwich domain of polyadenylation factor n=1 Tax=Leishmania utingensis TaxID=653362 RepID=A0AAW3ACX4_9TRYP